VNSKHHYLVRVLGLAIVLGSVAVAPANATSGSTPQGLKADGLRLQAMARVYTQLQSRPAQSTPQGLKAEGLRLQEMAQVYQRLQSRPAASFYTPQALKAEGMRWQTMAKVYGGQKLASAPMASSSSGFNWSDAGIGAVGGLGFAVFAAGLILVARRIRRTKLAI